MESGQVIISKVVKARLPVKASIIAGANPESKHAKRKKFNKMDRNSDGEVDHRELLLALRADKSIADILSMPSKVKASDGTRQTFDDVFKSMDKDASGTISWAEFAHALGY